MLVAGATGGVGQLVTAKLLQVGAEEFVSFTAVSWRWPSFTHRLIVLQRGFRVRAVVRSLDKARQVLGEAPGLEVLTCASAAHADWPDAHTSS